MNNLTENRIYRAAFMSACPKRTAIKRRATALLTRKTLSGVSLRISRISVSAPSVWMTGTAGLILTAPILSG